MTPNEQEKDCACGWPELQCAREAWGERKGSLKSCAMDFPEEAFTWSEDLTGDASER